MKHFKLSELEKDRPGSIIRHTGVIAHCNKCWKPYRRMATDPDTPKMCGRCYPPGGPKQE